MSAKTKKRTYKQQSFFRLIIVAIIILLLNILSSAFYTRIDLTADKRFTLNDSTVSTLRKLNDKVFVKVYLSGDLPAEFKRLENSTRDLLNEFRNYGKDNIQYQFEDPLLNKSEEDKKQIYQEMQGKGLQPTNIQVKGSDQYSEKIVVPGATIYYKGKESSVQLLQNNDGVDASNKLNNSVAQLENKFYSAIKKLSLTDKVKIGIVRGQDEMPLYNMYDIITSLSDFYEVDTIDIRKQLSIDNSYKMLIIAKPIQPFNEQDKFKLDQFIMRGGNVIWLLDNMKADLDSLQVKPQFVSLDYGLNLDDQLFTYGVRINPSLLMDLNCNPVPLLVNYINNQPEFRLFPCIYFPVLIPFSNHIITKDLDPISTQFASTLDTSKVIGIKKTVLLTSSRYSKQAFTPWLVDFKTMKDEPDKTSFNKSFLNVAVLLEGKFTSAFNNRLSPEFETILRDSLKQPFLAQGKESKQIIISDGDMIRNEFSSQGRPFSLGYYKYTQEFFDNKKFLLNCIDYMCGRTDQIVTRSKDVKLRMLDKEKVKAEKTKWQLINIVLPIVIIILFGFLYAFIRLRRYSV